MCLHHFHHPTLSPLQLTSCLPYSISNSWRLLHYCMCITYNLMSTFSVDHMHMCLRMSTWYWITYHELCPQKRQILPLLRNYWLPIPHHLVGALVRFHSVGNVSWGCHYTCFVWAIILLNFHLCNFHIMSKRPYVIWVILVIYLIIFDIFISLFLVN